MINLSKEQITDMMTFVRLNDEQDLTAIVKVKDLMQYYEGEESLDWLDIFIKKYNESRDFQITDIRDREKLLDDLRPKGEWLWLGDNPNSNHKWSCNKCGHGVKERENYCPNCGAKMMACKDSK